MPKTLYISSEILKWETLISTTSSGDINNIKRPYEILYHSNNLIESGSTEFDLSDAIGNLKRALNHRLKAIESYYAFNSIKFPGKPKSHLETLELYGLARPYIIKKLMDIRNDIEHKDTKPPKKERCKELIDITWYFLKSTDRLVTSIPLDIELSPLNLPEKYWGSVGAKRNWKTLNLKGWFPSHYISRKPFEKSFRLNCSVTHDGSYWKDKYEEIHKDKTTEDIWLDGILKIDDSEKHLFVRKFFEAY